MTSLFKHHPGPYLIKYQNVEDWEDGRSFFEYITLCDAKHYPVIGDVFERHPKHGLVAQKGIEDLPWIWICEALNELWEEKSK